MTLEETMRTYVMVRADVERAQERGRISAQLLKDAGQIRIQLQAAGAGSFTLAEARRLYEAALSIPAVEL